MGSVVPQLNFPVFEGSNPKLWKKRCEIFFEFYAVPVDKWVKLGVLNFDGSALLWLQSMEARVNEMGWEELCVALCNRFGRDQYGSLIRQFFHIHQNGSVSEYIEHFDTLMHQLLDHDNNLTSAMITGRFVDGFREDIRAMIMIQRPPDLDTACALALLQEDVVQQHPRRDARRSNMGPVQRVTAKQQSLPLPSPPPSSVPTPTFTRPVESASTEKRRNFSGTRSSPQDTKMAALMAYRRAKGLCFKCGERWSHTHTCSATVPLHLVEEMWALALDEADDISVYGKNTGGTSEAGEQILAISSQAVQGSEGRKTVRLHGCIVRRC